MFDTTILVNKIEGLKKAYENGNFGDALVTALNTGNGLMQQRIFTETQDIEGNSFGQYVGAVHKARLKKNKRNKSVADQYLTAYQRKRLLAGRQIAKKDLEFSGGLRRSIETKVENEKAAVLEFNTDLAAKVARGQENQISNIRNGSKAVTRGNGIRIFKLNGSEKEKVVEQGRELLKQILK